MKPLRQAVEFKKKSETAFTGCWTNAVILINCHTCLYGSQSTSYFNWDHLKGAHMMQKFYVNQICMSSCRHVHLYQMVKNLLYMVIKHMEFRNYCCVRFLIETEHPNSKHLIIILRKSETAFAGCWTNASVLAPDGMIISLVGPFEGRTHDAEILRESNLYEQLQTCASLPDGQKFVIYGDQAYGIQELLLCPFSNRN
nr:unnamed protein product [Callosobruchus chinensis]